MDSNHSPTGSLPIAGERILVTGASGFLGSHLCRRLLQERADVHGVSRQRRESERGGIHWIQGDMADIHTSRSILCEIEPRLIFHFSGLATASPDRELVLATLHSLLVSTVNVLTVAAEIRCRRVVLAASLTEPEPGSTEITPGSPYAAAKWASAAYARMFHKLYGLPVVMVRPFMTYGPAQDAHKLIPHVIISLLTGEAPKLSSGQQRIDWIYIDDVTDGFMAAAVAPGIEGETIDLGSGVLTPIRAVVEKITAIAGSQVDPLFGALADRPLERERVSDVAQARHKLGWKPKISLDRGLEQTVAWYKAKLAQSREWQSAERM